MASAARVLAPPLVRPTTSAAVPRCTSGSRRRQPLALPPLAAAAAGGSDTASSRGAVVVLPGFLFASRQYADLVASLRAKGHPTEVVPTAFADWLPSFTGGSFEWYLQRLDRLLSDMHTRHGRVALVAHSAGGWLARIVLGCEPYQGVRYGRSAQVHTLLTLGTPHQSIEAYPFGRTEEALHGPHVVQAPSGVGGSSLKFANHFYPDAASLGGVRVVCACGDAVRGRALWGAGSAADGSSSMDDFTLSHASLVSTASVDGSAVDAGTQPSRYDQWLAFGAYKSGCGRGDVVGDFVTPLCISQLPGAEALILPGVWHIPRRTPGQLWYGDAEVQAAWEHLLLEPQCDRAAVGGGAP